jgi:hypothetical protein
MIYKIIRKGIFQSKLKHFLQEKQFLKIIQNHSSGEHSFPFSGFKIAFYESLLWTKYYNRT